MKFCNKNINTKYLNQNCMLRNTRIRLCFYTKGKYKVTSSLPLYVKLKKTIIITLRKIINFQSFSGINIVFGVCIIKVDKTYKITTTNMLLKSTSEVSKARDNFIIHRKLTTWDSSQNCHLESRCQVGVC